MPQIATPRARNLCHELSRLLVAERSLNEFFELSLSMIAETFAATRVALVDYYEQTDRFDVLHFEGFEGDLHDFRDHLDDLEIRHALRTNQPFHPESTDKILLLPLRFSDVLEAVLILEDDAPINLDDEMRECGRVVARILGLLMSSSRLAVNRRFHFAGADLRRAREIQLSFLPREYPRTDRYELYGLNRSSAMVGGDYFDYFQHRQGSLQTILADACGHGLAAALIMSNFRGLLQAQLASHHELDEIFNRLNEAVHFEADFIQYLTGVYLDLDQESGELRYLNAGHFDPVVVSLDGSTRELSGGGPPLGMFKGSQYAPARTALARGDLVLLFTDGLVEIERETSEEPFGKQRILLTARANVEEPLSEIAHRILEEATRFAGDGGIEDDVTLLLLRLR